MSDDQQSTPPDSPAGPEAARGHKPFAHSNPVTPEELAALAKSREGLAEAAAGAKRAGSLSKLAAGPARGANAWARYTGLGIQMAVMIAGPTWLGLWLGQRYDFEPWGVVIGFLFGAPAAITSVILSANRMNREEQRVKASRARGARSGQAPGDSPHAGSSASSIVKEEESR